MSDFSVQHGALDDVNMQLKSACTTMKTILDDVNSVLAGINQAAAGDAADFWTAEQGTWNRSYQEMDNQLNSGSLSSHKIAEIWREGNCETGRYMANG
jgi:uncharacterized protein YukE